MAAPTSSLNAVLIAMAGTFFVTVIKLVAFLLPGSRNEITR